MQTVKIRLRKPRRVLSFLCDNLALHRDELCVVQSDRGPELGLCLLPPEPCSEEMGRKIAMRVLRKLSTKDQETNVFLAEEEKKAHEVCLGKIKQHNMPMKLVDVEYTFDKKKIIFYFTAEDRVDFRELVRDLAQDLRTRIELRHIQVRDEAKMVGGLGSCGRQLCCSSWLNEFLPISMRMAKRQNLSLNPSKISGQCGRLLCCLSYENDQYEAFKRKKKKPEAEQQPPPGIKAKTEAPKQESLPPRKKTAPQEPKLEKAPVAPNPSEDAPKQAPEAQEKTNPAEQERAPKKNRRGRRKRSRRRGKSGQGSS